MAEDTSLSASVSACMLIIRVEEQNTVPLTSDFCRELYMILSGEIQVEHIGQNALSISEMRSKGADLHAILFRIDSRIDVHG